MYFSTIPLLEENAFKKTLLKFIFSYLFFSIHSQLAFAYAPTNLDGYKSALTIDSATVDATGETHLLYFTSTLLQKLEAVTMGNGILI